MSILNNKCNSCGGYVADDATGCPHCGHHINPGGQIAVIIIIVIVAMLVGIYNWTCSCIQSVFN